MTIWEDIAKALGGNVEYTYPNSRNKTRGLAAFAPTPMGITPSDSSVMSTPALPINPMPADNGLAAFAQPVQTQEPQNQIAEPYNMLERAFLGLGGQGAAVKEDKQRYQLAKLAQSIPADPKDPVGSALQKYAFESPDGAKAYLEYAMNKQKASQPDWQVKEVNGRLVRYDANNPTQVEGLTGQGGIGADVKGESELRKEFDTLNKDYRIVNDAYNKIQKSANDPSAAGDLALIFSYMKILDPGSTVREGEFATAQNAAGIPTRIQNLWNRAQTGERLSSEQRADFLNQSKNLYDAQAEGYKAGVTKYRGLATEYGYNPDRIVKPIAEPPVDPLAAKKAELRAKIDAIKKARGLK